MFEPIGKLTLKQTKKNTKELKKYVSRRQFYLAAAVVK